MPSSPSTFAPGRRRLPASMADRGRPKKDPTERRSKLLQMRVTEDELALIKRAAHRDEKGPAQWVRDLAVEEAQRRTGKRGA